MTDFLSFPRPAIDAILPFLTRFEPVQSFPAGTKLYPQGAESRSVFVIGSGVVKQEWVAPTGVATLVTLRASGSVLGATATIAEVPYPVSTIAVTRCDTWRIPRQEFQDLVRSQAAFSWYLHQLTAYESLLFLRRTAIRNTLPAMARLEALLEEISGMSVGATPPHPVPLHDRELAQLIGVTPTYLSRLVKRLVAEGRLRRVESALVLSEQVPAGC